MTKFDDCITSIRKLTDSAARLQKRFDEEIHHATRATFRPNNIKVGSHFGTFAQAKDRAQNIHDLNLHTITPDKDPTKFHLHKYDYNPTGKVPEVTDNWENRPSHYSVGRQLAKQGHIPRGELERLQGTPFKTPKQSEDAHHSLFLKHGISGVKYKNVHEDQFGEGHSHIVYNKNDLKHIGSTTLKVHNDPSLTKISI